MMRTFSPGKNHVNTWQGAFSLGISERTVPLGSAWPFPTVRFLHNAAARQRPLHRARVRTAIKYQRI